jgi:hypothetical protein
MVATSDGTPSSLSASAEESERVRKLRAVLNGDS